MPVNHAPPPWQRILPRLQRLLSFALLPPRCLLCGEPAQEMDLCAACIAALPCNTVACPRCALPLPHPAPACGRCLTQPPPLSNCITPWLYADGVARLLPRFKFHHDLACGQVLVQLAAAQLAQWPGWAGVNRVVPLPLHPTRLGRRGYNQALELARPLARQHALRLDPGLLQRQRATAPQTDLDAAARRRNLRGAFRARPCDGVVLLVDDVITTGATLHEAARTLLRAGAHEVRALALARAP